MPGNFASACGAQTKVRMGVPAAGISMYEEVMITARSFQTFAASPKGSRSACKMNVFLKRSREAFGLRAFR